MPPPIDPKTRKAIGEMVRTDMDRGETPRTSDVMMPDLRRRGFEVPDKALVQVVRSTAIDNYRFGWGGRPLRTPEPDETQRVGLSLRVTPECKRRLDDAAQQNDRSLSQQAELIFERAFDDRDALDRAVTLAYGANNGPFLHLIGEALGVLAPRGEWLDDEKAVASVATGFIHLLRRLRAPDDGTPGTGLEAEHVDRLLYDFGDDGTQHPRSPVGAHQRWAEEKRKRFGPAVGPRLIRIRGALRKALEEGPGREMPEPDPASAAIWEPEIARIDERVETPEGDGPAEAEE
jgi:hypothetical protein